MDREKTDARNIGRLMNMDRDSIFYVIGTSYAGKSTVVKNLAEKHSGIALEENYHDAKLPELDSREFPNLTYTRDLQDWHEFADTNICVETLHRISDEKHVLVMMAPPETGINRFFERPDAEKQFLYRLMLEEPDPQAALDNFREILTRIHSKESYDELLHSGFRILFRDEERSQEETVRLAEEIFGLD